MTLKKTSYTGQAKKKSYEIQIIGYNKGKIPHIVGNAKERNGDFNMDIRKKIQTAYSIIKRTHHHLLTSLERGRSIPAAGPRP